MKVQAIIIRDLMHSELSSLVTRNGLYNLVALVLLTLAGINFINTQPANRTINFDGESGNTLPVESSMDMLTQAASNPSNPVENLLLHTLKDQKENEVQTITFNPLAPATYGDPVIMLSAIASSGLPVTFESDDSDVATVSGNSLTIIGVGTVNIIASQSGNENFEPAQDVIQILTVNKAILSAIADNKTKIYGDPIPVFTITYSGFKGSDNASVIDTPPLLTTTATQFTPVDSYDISFISEGSDNNYEITFTDGTLTISKATLTAVADNKTKEYGEPNPIFTITYIGFKGSDNASVIETPPLITTTATQFTPVDSYDISFVSEGSADNYEITYTDGTLTITQATLTAIADNKTKDYGNPNPTFTITYTGFKGSDNASVIDTPPALATDAAQFSPVESYIIFSISEGSDNDYEIASVTQGTLTIKKADQTIDFEDVANKTKLDIPFTLIATSTSGLPVNFASSNTSVISISGTTATIHTSGATIITASQAGDTNFNAANGVMQEVIVSSKVTQSITFEAIPDKTYGDAPFELTATASSGLPIVFLSSNTEKVTINGSQVTLLNAGLAMISATQPGNDDYNAVDPVTQSFCVNPTKPVISVANNNSASPTLTSSASSGNQWYKDGLLISEATNSVINAIEPGVYTVKVKVETCESTASDPIAIIITGDIKNHSIDLVMHPNPADDRLEVDFSGFESEVIAIAFIDPHGRIIEKHVVQNGRKTFYIDHLAPGTYWILATQSRYKVTKQFIKK